MSPELDERLCKDFPLLYKDRHGNPRHTLMCWGFPEDGWEPLIRRLSEKLERAISDLSEEVRQEYCAVQVKEKFGTLRFYMTAETQEMSKWIEEAEEESERTCEKCGQPGQLVKAPWLYTSCKEHAKKEHKDQFNAQ